MRIYRPKVLLLITLCSCISPLGVVQAQVITGSARTRSSVQAKASEEWEITLNPVDRWFDTGIKIISGSMLNILATGRVTWDREVKQVGTVGPEGTPQTADRLPRPSDFPLPSATCGSLLMKIGDVIYAVGAGGFVTVEEPGTIQVMVNDRYQGLADNTGSFFIRVKLAKPLDKKQAFGFSFDLIEARMNAGYIICNLIITSVNEDRDIGQDYDYSKMVDNFGNEYRHDHVQFANRERYANLVANIPTASTFRFKGVNSGATRIALLELRLETGRDSFVVSFRNVPITR